MRRVRLTVALAALAGAGAVAGLLALSHGGGGGGGGAPLPPRAPLLARASFDPPAPGFGDRITATIAIDIDRRLARAGTLRLRYDLAPLAPLGPAHTVRIARGGVELVTVAVPVACISDACLARSGTAQLRLAPVRARIATASGPRSVLAPWPAMAVRDRVRAADAKAAQPPLQADAAPLPATYSVDPGALAAALDVVAALLGLAAVALAAWQLERFARRRGGAREGPLARAVALARSAQSLPVPERRRALETLARTLGDGELGSEATRLAWSQPPPEPAAVETLVSSIEREEPQ